jgi:excisionase family DNA binding protein
MVSCGSHGAIPCPQELPEDFSMKHRDHFNTADFMSVPEAARYLGVGRKMIYQLIENGDLAFTRERGAVRILTETIVAFREAGRLV